MSDREALAQIVVEHVVYARKSWYPHAVCVCGWRGTYQEHYGHVADQIIAAGWAKQ